MATHFKKGTTVSIIIPVHNGGMNFSRCLQSVFSTFPQPNEVIVVADGDTDGSFGMAQEFGATAFRRSTPGGPAVARNLGANKARGDILFFVDADVTISGNAIEQVVTTFQNDPDLAAAFGSYDDEPFQTNFLSQYKNLFHHYVHQTGNEEASTFWAACGAIRREVFLAMDGFDESYPRPSIEDIELGYRLKKAGHKIRLLKNLQVKHLKRWTVISLLNADFFCRALPWTNLILSGGRFIDDLNLSISNRVSVVSVYALLLCVLTCFWIPWALVPALLAVMILLTLNRDLYRFYHQRQGLSFAIKTIPWHWFYFFYSGLAFAFGFLRHKSRKFLS